jgi:hypothetical protein
MPLTELAHTLALCVALGPAAAIDVWLTAPALEANCASACEDAGATVSSFERSWTRGRSSTCVCAGRGPVSFEDTTWWALVEVLVFFASMPLALMLVHALAPKPLDAARRE